MHPLKSKLPLFSLQGRGRGEGGVNTFRYQYQQAILSSDENVSQREKKRPVIQVTEFKWFHCHSKTTFGSKMSMAQLLQQPRAVSTDIQTERQQP